MGALEARDITGSVQAHRLGCSSEMGAIPPWSFTKVAPDGYSRIKMEQILKKQTVVCFWPWHTICSETGDRLSDTTHRESSDATLDDGCPRYNALAVTP